MPIYRIPDTVEVELSRLELPAEIPIDLELNEKPLADCSKTEIDQAVKAFSCLLRHGQREIERTIQKHIEIRRRLAHLQAYRQHFDDISWVRERPE
jgi:hypothetical protein